MHQIVLLMSLFMGEIKELSQLRLVGLTPPEQWSQTKQEMLISHYNKKQMHVFAFFSIIKID